MERAGVFTNVSANRRLGYTAEFRQLLRENPGVMGAALRLAEQVEDTYSPDDIQYGPYVLRWSDKVNNWQTVSRGEDIYDEPLSLARAIWGRGALLKPGNTITDPTSGLEVTALGKASRELGSLFGGIDRVDISSYFKMELQDKSFFVKKSYATTNPGFDEFTSTIAARQALASIKGLDVVEAHLGYSDDQQSWFVSRWEDLENSGFFPYDTFVGGVPNDYAERLDSDECLEIIRSGINPRVDKLKDEIVARGSAQGITILDLNANLFYNPKTDKFFYLDVSTKEAGRLNQRRLNHH